MQISINVDETQFKELMDKSLATLPEEKLQEVVLEGFRTYLTNTNVLKELTMEKDSWGYEMKPTQFLKEIMLATVDTEEDAFREIQKFLDEHNFKSYYTRTWIVPEENNAIYVDFGSWSEYMVIRRD